MRKIALLLCLIILLCGCSQEVQPTKIAATTLPVYEFTTRLCEGTDISVSRLITENVSCLHDYTLQTSQMRTMESAELVVISGAGLEDFLGDILQTKSTIDASANVEALHAQHEHHDHEDEHHHEHDPHIWLSPENAKIMVQNICQGLCKQFPGYAEKFTTNQKVLTDELDALQTYGQTQLAKLQCRELVTFHDGFAYFAEAFDLTIVKAIEEESGSEASAAELIELAELVVRHDLPAIFTEANGSTAAASIIARETGVKIYHLDMAMAGDSYFKAMYHNIDTIKEALE